MTSIKTKIAGRRLVLDVPDDWPDGLEVEIHPFKQGTRADADTLTAEEIAETLAAMDQVEPFQMTDAEQAAMEGERKARRDWEKARFAEHAERLGSMWP